MKLNPRTTTATTTTKAGKTVNGKLAYQLAILEFIPETLAQKTLLLYYALRVNKDGQFFPSMAQIAHDTLLSETWVGTCNKYFRDLGILSWITKARRNRRRYNLYQFNLPRLQEIVASQPEFLTAAKLIDRGDISAPDTTPETMWEPSPIRVGSVGTKDAQSVLCSEATNRTQDGTNHTSEISNHTLGGIKPHSECGVTHHVQHTISNSNKQKTDIDIDMSDKTFFKSNSSGVLDESDNEIRGASDNAIRAKHNGSDSCVDRKIVASAKRGVTVYDLGEDYTERACSSKRGDYDTYGADDDIDDDGSSTNPAVHSSREKRYAEMKAKVLRLTGGAQFILDVIKVLRAEFASTDYAGIEDLFKRRGVTLTIDLNERPRFFDIHPTVEVLRDLKLLNYKGPFYRLVSTEVLDEIESQLTENVEEKIC
jgi:hypothetical protein